MTIKNTYLLFDPGNEIYERHETLFGAREALERQLSLYRRSAWFRGWHSAVWDLGIFQPSDIDMRECERARPVPWRRNLIEIYRVDGGADVTYRLKTGIDKCDTRTVNQDVLRGRIGQQIVA